MKKVLFILSFLFLANSLYSKGFNADVFVELINTLNKKQEFNDRKEERIERLKSLKVGSSLLEQYEYNLNLFLEYRKFQLDSAISYVRKNLLLAEELKRVDLVNKAQLQLATLYTSTGLYREAEGILMSLKKRQLDIEMLANYYDTYSQFYGNYLANHNPNQYKQHCELYRDSLLALLDSSSLRYRLNIAEKSINMGVATHAEKDLLKLFALENEDTPNHAMIAYLLGQTYRLKKQSELAKQFFAISAITDLRISNKDNASLQNLAVLFFESGDIDNAYKCSRSALGDAIFSNVQFRTLRMSELYNIINTAYLAKEAKSKGMLRFYLILISFLTLSLSAAIVYVYKQYRKLSNTREELFQTTQQLAELNKDISLSNIQLQEANCELSESNHIKEEYIAHFFDLCSTYINKLENFRSTLNKKALSHQHDELFKILKSTTLVETELEELYKTFDTIFINLYPSFVKEFNALLIAEEQIVLKPGEILNTELRVFALIRLGITDSVKIAAFLRYSLSSIYNYRTRARNKAVVSRNEFDEMVAKIGSLNKKAN